MNTNFKFFTFAFMAVAAAAVSQPGLSHQSAEKEGGGMHSSCMGSTMRGGHPMGARAGGHHMGMMGGGGMGMMNGGHHMGMMGGDHMGMLGRLNLTAEQQQQVDDIIHGLHKQQWALKGQMMDHHYALKKLYAEDVVDPDGVSAVYGQMFALRQQMIVNSIIATNGVREVLTDEQREAMKQFKHGRGGMHGGGMHKGGMHKGGTHHNKAVPCSNQG